MSDPTGTAGLRRAFLAEGNRRLARVRSLTHAMLVEHDLMHARNDPVAELLGHPGQRLPLFTDWFERVVDAQLLGGLPAWWERYLVRAYNSGLAAGSELVKNSETPPSGGSSLPAVYRGLALAELTGIAAALVQHVSRQAAGAALGRQKPQLLYRAVLGAIRKVGEARLKAFVELMTVKLHNAARLAQFRSAGIEEVGIVPELLVVPRPSRFIKHDHLVRDQDEEFVNVLTAGDDLVCIECQDISESGPYALDEAEGLIPAHPNAVLEGTTVASYGAMHEMVRARFSGPAVYLRTGAKLLAIGPNHPMLTGRGWLKAREVCEGDELLCDPRAERGSISGGGRDLEQMPMVQDVFEAATLESAGLSAKASHDLHGDRVFCEGEVEVVRPARRLLPILDSCGVEHLGKGKFEWADVSATFVAGLRASNAGFARVLSAAISFVRRDDLAFAFTGGHLRPLDVLLFACGTAGNSSALQNAIDYATARAELCRQRKNTEAFQVGGHNWPFRWDRVLAVHVRQFSGWAFDASTATGLYNADGYFVHNCRCAFIPADDMRFALNRAIASGDPEKIAEEV